MTKSSIGYSICPVENRVQLLNELVSRYFDVKQQVWTKKIVIIFHHDNSVKFFVELLEKLKQLPIMPIMETGLNSQEVLDDLAGFSETGTGALALSANSALAQSALLEADTIIQFDPPVNVEFVETMSALCKLYVLFIRPEEMPFVTHLTEEKQMSLEELAVPWKRVKQLPSEKIEDYYKKLYSMNINGKGSYKGYMDCLKYHEMQEFFNLEDIDIKEVAKGYCMPIPPYYKMKIEVTRYETEKKRKMEKKSQPLPPTAKRVVNVYKKTKKAKRQVEAMEENEEEVPVERKRQRKITDKVGLIKQTKKLVGVKKVRLSKPVLVKRR